MKSLLKYNTFGIDLSCKNIYEPTTVLEAKKYLHEIHDEPLLIIGGGSNLLLTKNFDGNVIHSRIKGMEVMKDTDPLYIDVRCGSGEVWDDMVAYAVDNNMYGVENLSIIPGEVGASAVQNIGAYGVEAKNVINKIEAIEIATGKELIIDPKECQYAYRYSRFKGDWKDRYFITYVTYRLSRQFVPHLDYGNLSKHPIIAGKLDGEITAQMVREAIIDCRNAKLPDPKIEGNAGSFFMNPIVKKEKFETLLRKQPSMPYYKVDEEHYKIPAGWMIEQCGWKGKTRGRAGVHSKQALVLVNRGGATGKEIVELCDAIRIDVFNKFGVMITPEVNII